METRYSVSIYNNIFLKWLFLQDAWLVGILAQGSSRSENVVEYLGITKVGVSGGILESEESNLVICFAHRLTLWASRSGSTRTSATTPRSRRPSAWSARSPRRSRMSRSRNPEWAPITGTSLCAWSALWPIADAASTSRVPLIRWDKVDYPIKITLYKENIAIT